MREELGGAPPAPGGEGDDVVEVRGGVAQPGRGHLICERGHLGVLVRRRRWREQAIIGAGRVRRHPQVAHTRIGGDHEVEPRRLAGKRRRR